MTRTQLIVLWTGIVVLVLTGILPPGARGGYAFIVGAGSLSLTRLLIEWVIVVAVTGGLMYSLKSDPDLMLKIASGFLCFLGTKPYKETLKKAKEHRTSVIVFWVVVLALLLFGLIAIRLSLPVPHMLSYSVPSRFSTV